MTELVGLPMWFAIAAVLIGAVAGWWLRQAIARRHANSGLAELREELAKARTALEAARRQRDKLDGRLRETSADRDRLASELRSVAASVRADSPEQIEASRVAEQAAEDLRSAQRRLLVRDADARQARLDLAAVERQLADARRRAAEHTVQLSHHVEVRRELQQDLEACRQRRVRYEQELLEFAGRHERVRRELDTVHAELGEQRARSAGNAGTSNSVAAPRLPGGARAEPAGTLRSLRIASTSARDDLKVIDGIGPKIEGLLRASGVETLAQLATTAPSRLRQILAAAGPGYRVHDPAAWPRQARSAAVAHQEERAMPQGAMEVGREV